MKKITIVRGLLALGLALGLVSTILTAGTNQPAIPVVAATAEDNTSDRTITLHKYTESATPTSAQATGTTADASNVPADSKPLQGIQFRVERVDKVAGKTLDASDSSTYAVDNSFPAKTTTTGSDGKAQLTVGTGKDADGYYLVTEVASKLVATATAPFIVHLPQTTKNASTGDMTLLYDVNVYPKNKVDDNAVALNPEKFVTNDTSGTGATATSVMQGGFAIWNLVVTRPADIKATDDNGNTTYAKEVAFSDPLVTSNLKYLGYNTPYFKEPDGTKVDLDTSDYDDSGAQLNSLVTDGKYSVLTFKLKAAGIQKFAAEPAGTKLTVPIGTTVNPDVTGKIINTFDTFYQGTATNTIIHEHSGTTDPLKGGATDVDKPVLPTNADTGAPVIYTGNVDIHKTNENGNNVAHATFKLYNSKTDAEAGKNPVQTGPSADPSVPDHDLTAVSNAQGIAEFTGLKVDPTTQQQTYWVVETDAPVGYDLNGQVFEVTAKRDTTVDATVKDHDNVLPNLPLTGRDGRLLLYGVAALLIGTGGLGVIFMKRRHAAPTK